MRYEKGKRQKTIIADTGEAFDDAVNNALLDFIECQVTYKDIPDKFCCIILGKYSKEIPETALERHELSGDKHYCCECKEWTRPTKGSVKYTECVHGGRCAANTPCCEFYYDMVDAGQDMGRYEK